MYTHKPLSSSIISILCLKLLEHLGLSSKAVLGLAAGYAQRKGKGNSLAHTKEAIQIASSPYPITSHHIHTIPHPIISHLCCVLACMLGLDILWRTLAWLQKNTNNFIPRPRCIKPGAYKPYLQNAPPPNPLGISLTTKSFCEGRTL